MATRATGASTGREPSERTGVFVTLLRAIVVGLAAAVVAWELALPWGIAAAALGAVCGSLLGGALADSPLRTGTIWGLAVGVAVACLGLSALFIDSELIATRLGLLGAMAVSDAVRWLGLSFTLSAALRITALRHRSVAVVEVGIAAAAFVTALAAHRDGAIHRPTELSDLVFTRGGDPAIWILGLGAVGALGLATVLLTGRRFWRATLDLAGVATLILLIVAVVRVVGGPQPPGRGGLGLTGKSSQSKEREERAKRAERARQARGAGGGGQSGEGAQGAKPQQSHDDDLPFRDDYTDFDQAPVAVVLLHDDYAPPTGYYYFRQSVFSQYNGHRLIAPTRGDVDRDIIADYPVDGGDPVEVAYPPPLTGRKEIRTTVALLADHLRPFALESPLRIEALPNPDTGRFRRTYDAVSRPLTLGPRELMERTNTLPPWDEGRMGHYLGFPEDPRYKALSEKILATIKPERQKEPYIRALAIKRWLEQNGVYTKKSAHAKADDPTASFLFGDLHGYCVHFSHAAVYLMRAAGLPARVAAGYGVSEEDRGRGSAILIRGSNAHAWPEIFLAGLGWVVVDIAPEKTLDPPTPRPDQDLQALLGELARKQKRMLTPKQEAQRAQLLRLLVFVIGTTIRLLMLGLLILYGGKVWRRVAPVVFQGERAKQIRLTYRAALDQLAELGHRRARGETREGFAARWSALAPTFATLTWAHLAAALGSRRPGQDARPLRQQMARELRAHVPVWRRILGILDPVAWLRAR